MKKMQSLLLILTLIGSGFVYAQSPQPEFPDVMGMAIKSLQEVKSPQDMINARNTMERISMKFPDQWLPVYYIGFTDITLSFANESKEKKLAYLS